tara:strand:+ start:2027 stop:2158 length:132 start_codon:yes stop_codon:yes gene_type:complete
MGMNEIMSEDKPKAHRKKKKQTSDEGDDNKKKIEIHIVCCTIM